MLQLRFLVFHPPPLSETHTLLSSDRTDVHPTELSPYPTESTFQPKTAPAHHEVFHVFTAATEIHNGGNFRMVTLFSGECNIQKVMGYFGERRALPC